LAACGITSDKLVEAHGSFATAACIRCGKSYNAEDIRSTIFEDKIPMCTKCDVSIYSLQINTYLQGLIKPNIVFFGEGLPSRFRMYMTDAHETDLAIVMGTSLQVYPFASVVLEIPPPTTKLLINKHYVGGFNGKNDYVFEGNCVRWKRNNDTL
jgi:NAD-dependent SIR2 family protein deacetylase